MIRMLMLLDLLDAWNRPVTAEVMIRRETVEVRCRDRLAGIADRDILRTWLGAPFGVYAYDDITWLHLHPGIALCLADQVSGHVLTPHVVDDLRSRL
jgi:hypothetical protein